MTRIRTIVDPPTTDRLQSQRTMNMEPSRRDSYYDLPTHSHGPRRTEVPPLSGYRTFRVGWSHPDGPSQDLSVVPATPRPLPAIPYRSDERDTVDARTGQRSNNTDRLLSWTREQSTCPASADVNQTEPVTHRYMYADDVEHTRGQANDWALNVPTAQIIPVSREAYDGSDSSSSSKEIADDWPEPNQNEDPSHSPSPSRDELLQEKRDLREQLESYQVRESLRDENLRDLQKRYSELEDTLKTLQKERSKEASLLASTQNALSVVKKSRESMSTECDELKQSLRCAELELEIVKRLYVDAAGSAAKNKAEATSLGRSNIGLGHTIQDMGEDLAENELEKRGLGRLRPQPRPRSYERRSEDSKLPLSMPSFAENAART
jgi:hypothetical protein